jgi:hypothetical protein
MNDTLDLPTIQTEPMPVATKPAAPEPGTLKATALASFVAIRSHAAKLAEKYRAVAYDVTTPKGMAAAKDARLELREEGRFAVQRLRDRLKDEANDLKRVVTDEAEAVIKIIAPVEDAIHAQITAEEERKKAEKAEAARILAERQQKQADGVAGIRGYLSLAQTTADMTAARVANGIKMLESMTFPVDDWLDPVAVANAQCETLEGMRALHATLEAREAEAARLEAQRVENERIAAELAEQRRKADEEQKRIAGIMARIGEIRAAATGHDKASSADLYEARIAVAALDTSEAIYAEFTGLAEATQAATLAALDKLHNEATDREAAEAQRVADMVTAAAKLPDLPQERVAQIMRDLAQPLPLTIPDEAFPGTDDTRTISEVDQYIKAENAAVRATLAPAPAPYTPPPFGGYAGRPIYNPENPPPEFTEGQDLQQVLKAEGASPDATDRDAPAATSPRVGAMGAGQAADAAPAAEPLQAGTYPGAIHVDPATGDQSRVTLVVSDPLPTPTMTLGALNEWLAPVQVSAAGLELLGFPVAGRAKAAKLYHDTDRPAIVAAMVKHLQGLAA